MELSAGEQTYLIPTLNGGSNGVEENSIVKRPRVLPTMGDLLLQGSLLIII